MRTNEIIEASKGAKVNNTTVGELKELVTTVCKRLGIPQRKIPTGEMLGYVAEQMFKRHHYTPAELLLAVDYYNAGNIGYKIDAFDNFGAQQIHNLMQAYREVKEKVIRPEQSISEAEREIHPSQHKDIHDEFEAIYRSGGVPAPMVMMMWLLVYKYLLHQGGVTQARFDEVEGMASAAHKLETSRRGDIWKDPALIGSLVFGGKSIDVYQARIVVDEYFSNLMNK